MNEKVVFQLNESNVMKTLNFTRCLISAKNFFNQGIHVKFPKKHLPTLTKYKNILKI